MSSSNESNEVHGRGRRSGGRQQGMSNTHSSGDSATAPNSIHSPESPSPHRRRKSFKERIRHFTPSWFAMSMGKFRAFALILHNFPYGSKHILSFISLGVFLFNLVLFCAFCAMTIARYIMYPQTWRRMIRHPVQSAFIGCFPMALTTLINGAANVNRDQGFGGTKFLYFVWAIWCVEQALAFAMCFGMVYFMITRQEHTFKGMLATWLLPVVTLVVSATTGAIVAGDLILVHPSYGLTTVAIAAVSLFIGLSLSFMIMTVYLARLVLHQLPPKGFIVSKFLPLGPLGQGGTAFILLTQVISDLSAKSLLPHPFFSDPLTGSIMRFIGITLALWLWSNGVFWAWIGLAGILDVFSRNKIPFGVPFWGMTFPIGVFVLLNLQLAVELDSTFFRVVGTIIACGLFVLYGTILSKTIYMAIGGDIFCAPCLDDAPLSILQPESPESKS